MKKQINQVSEFHKAFNVPIIDTPKLPSVQRCKLRHDLLQEEVNELYDASKFGDVVEVADAIIDCLYVLLGTAVEYGLSRILEKCFDEVHRSNMSKLGLDGNPVVRHDGKVLKGENYSPPNLKQYFDDSHSSDSENLLNIPHVGRSFTACPSCGSENIYKDGWWTCRDCTYDWGGK